MTDLIYEFWKDGTIWDIPHTYDKMDLHIVYSEQLY
jgi:hypothetical protein